MTRATAFRTAWALTLAATALSACRREPAGARPGAAPETGEPAIVIRHSRHLSAHRRGDIVVVRVSAPVRSWSGAGSTAQVESQAIVLVPREAPLPTLPPDLADAVVVRTPVARIAVNSGTEEAFLAELGLEDRLVAVGGLKSYNDAIRARAKAGELGQVGYSWHSPPNLDVALAAKPDVFVMRLANLDHVPSLRRAQALGIPAIPYFPDAEPTYLARAEWIKLFGLLAGRTRQAAEKFDAVERNVAELRARVAGRPRRTVLWAYLYGGDKWSATVRNAEAGFVDDAGGRNVLREADDPALDPWAELTTEALLARGRDAECWLVGDIHARPLPDAPYLADFRAWREGCLLSNDGRSKPQIDAFDWYETAWVRPDLVLADFVEALHSGPGGRPLEFLRRFDRPARP